MVVLLAVLLPDDQGDTGIGLAAFAPGTRRRREVAVDHLLSGPPRGAPVVLRRLIIERTF
jgi:hypothetical protein